MRETALKVAHVLNISEQEVISQSMYKTIKQLVEYIEENEKK